MGKYKHGLTYSPEWYIWRSMRNRCNNVRNPYYHNYGGRGIKVCYEWNQSFTNFYTDMGPRPSDKHTIERKDNNEGYNKNNCRWATKEEQRRNTRRNKIIAYNGEKLCVNDWARKIGIKAVTLQKRLYSGWPIEKALTTQSRRWNRK